MITKIIMRIQSYCRKITKRLIRPSCLSWKQKLKRFIRLVTSSKPLEFVYTFFRYRIEEFSPFFKTVYWFFMNNICHFLQCIDETPLNSTLFELFWYFLPFMRYKRSIFNFFNSVPYSVVKICYSKKCFALKINKMDKIFLNFYIRAWSQMQRTCI